MYRIQSQLFSKLNYLISDHGEGKGSHKIYLSRIELYLSTHLIVMLDTYVRITVGPYWQNSAPEDSSERTHQRKGISGSDWIRCAPTSQLYICGCTLYTDITAICGSGAVTWFDMRRYCPTGPHVVIYHFCHVAPFYNERAHLCYISCLDLQDDSIWQELV